MNRFPSDASDTGIIVVVGEGIRHVIPNSGEWSLRPFVGSGEPLAGRRRQPWRLEEQVVATRAPGGRRPTSEPSVDTTVDPASPSHSWAPDVARPAWGADVGSELPGGVRDEDA
jgi:hypothetical protein